MFQTSFDRAQKDAREAPLDDDADMDVCPHCGRGSPLAEEMELELAADEAVGEDAEPDPADDKAAFIAALRKESR